MIKIKHFLALSVLSGVMLVGCGKPAEKVSGDSDNCVVVQTPAGNNVETLFDFKRKEKLALSNWGDDNSSSTIYYVGELEDGNSVVWQSGNVFLYIPGEAKDTSIIHYKTRLQDSPISYEDFKNQNNNE